MRARLLGLIGSLALAALLPLGCGQDRTQLMIGIATDLTAPTDIDFVRLRAFRLEGNDSVGFEVTKTAWDLTTTQLPGSFGLYSSTASAIRLRLVLEGYRGFGTAGATLVVAREAIVSTEPEATRFLRLGLTAACRDRSAPCGSGLTCVEGQCVTRDIDVSTLPTYPPPSGAVDPVTTLLCDSGIAYRSVPSGEPMPNEMMACASPATCQEGMCR